MTIYSISAGGVVINKYGEVLVVSQRGTSWSLPKVHLNEGESILKAAKREIEEESGIKDLRLIKELGSYERPGINNPLEVKTIHMYLFKTDEINLKPIDPANPEARWIDMDKVNNFLTAEKDREFFDSVRLFLV
jgi:ADP-ribose pyrophosphatase YjhB (NUDIX family)